MKNKLIAAIITAALCVLLIPMCLKGGRTSDKPDIDAGSTDIPDTDGDTTDAPDTNAGQEVKKVTWDEITAEGVNEELLLENVDTELLAQIAAELQALAEEAAEEERQNPEIVITEGWARVFEYERYQKVLHMGSSAMKPLYLILYKSPNAGEYEYLCANILYELSGFKFDWTNSRNFMDGFNKMVLDGRL